MEQNHIPISKQVKTYIERKPYILEAIELLRDGIYKICTNCRKKK